MFERESFLKRSGYTLRDLLVVVAIFALVLTVGAPWILSARVSTSQNHNRNQVKQIGLALQNHHDQFRTFPPLFFSGDSERKRILNPRLAAECYSWQVRILPYLEEGKLYENLELVTKDFVLDSTQVQIPDPNNSANLISPTMVAVSVWHSNHRYPQSPGECYYAATPSTRLPLLTNVVTFSDGQLAYRHPPDGMIVPDKAASGQPMSRMSDGTSKTVVINETREQQRSNWFRPQQAFVCGFLPADSTPALSESDRYYPYFDWRNNRTWTFDPKSSDRTAINFSPYHDSSGDELSREWGPSGTHPQGKMLVGMGDGSTQEIDPENIDPKVYFSAITARGGEGIPSYLVE